MPAAPAAVATAGLFLGALVLGNRAKLMVIGGGLWLGATVAQRYFLGGGRGGFLRRGIHRGCASLGLVLGLVRRFRGGLRGRRRVLGVGVASVPTDSASKPTLSWAKERQPMATPKGSLVRPFLVAPRVQARLARVEVARGPLTRDTIKAERGDCL